MSLKFNNASQSDCGAQSPSQFATSEASLSQMAWRSADRQVERNILDALHQGALPSASLASLKLAEHFEE